MSGLGRRALFTVIFFFPSHVGVVALKSLKLVRDWVLVPKCDSDFGKHELGCVSCKTYPVFTLSRKITCYAQTLGIWSN